MGGGDRGERVTGAGLTLVARALAHEDRTAIVAPEGTFTYRELLRASAAVGEALLQAVARVPALGGRGASGPAEVDGGRCCDLGEARVAYLVPPGFQSVAVQWGIWRAGGIAVPLGVSHPPPELEYVIADSDAALVVVHPEFEAGLRSLAGARGAALLSTAEVLAGYDDRAAPGVSGAEAAGSSGRDEERGGAGAGPGFENLGAGRPGEQVRGTAWREGPGAAAAVGRGGPWSTGALRPATAAAPSGVSGADRGVGRAGAAAGASAGLPCVSEDQRALILYTSGTTGRPKGVVHTHASIRAQVEALVAAWEWRADDRILCVLPLHHVHGLVNVLTCALWSGACCEILPRFDAEAVWDRIARGHLTLFMAVPTIYAKLIAAWDAAAPERRRAACEGCAAMRLMVSGSAALPARVLERWREITGHTLLERYGMTETGMVLSNPLHGERVPGSVGSPLPGVYVRLVDEEGRPVEAGSPGEIEVRGPGLFLEYWRRPGATREAFRDGWFRTGDLAVLEDGRYRILGRSSVDIIKTGGYKVSALEVEEALRTHPAIRECAVVGIPDPEWGERVAAAVILCDGASLDLDSLRSWARERLAPYKVPSRFLTVDELPRNAMGKVQKPEVARLFGAPSAARAPGGAPVASEVEQKVAPPGGERGSVRAP